jgi:hypothetical protein
VGFSVGCCSSGRHLLHVDDVEALVLKAVGNSFRWRDWCKMIDCCLQRLSEFVEKVK